MAFSLSRMEHLCKTEAINVPATSQAAPHGSTNLTRGVAALAPGGVLHTLRARRVQERARRRRRCRAGDDCESWVKGWLQRVRTIQPRTICSHLRDLSRAIFPSKAAHLICFRSFVASCSPPPRARLCPLVPTVSQADSGPSYYN